MRDSSFLSRRAALTILGAGAWAARSVAATPAQPLPFTALDHVEIYVPDAARSAALYAGIFGAPVWKNNKTPRRYVKFGPCYIAIEQGNDPRRVDHISAGIADYQIAALHTFLDGRGLAYRDFPSGRDLNVTDPDGIRVQLSADQSWHSLEGSTASPEAGSSGGEPIFHATGIDHILLNVTDPEKSAAFYEKMFGAVTQRNNNRTWFQVGKSRIGLLQTPSGQKPGVNHFCVAATAFDYDAVTHKLEQAGAKVEKPEVAGAPEFRDLDGFLVQVMTPRS